MKTIREIFAKNLRDLRGDLSQEAQAERLDIPYRTYQECELGKIPREATLAKIAEGLGISETALFQDGDTEKELLLAISKTTPAQAITVIQNALAAVQNAPNDVIQALGRVENENQWRAVRAALKITPLPELDADEKESATSQSESKARSKA